MLKWLNRWRNQGKHLTRLKPVVIPRDQHSISRKNLSPAAVKTLYRLQDCGFDAYLIGGGVRDVLLGLSPKDFDIATNAKPEDVKQVFGSQCQIIGRRFRLAHVRWGREVIEVATFRANHADGDDQSARTNADGRILRDNVWGSIEEDAARRDFTINAVYYRIADFSLWDFANGAADLKQRVIRLIGDPETRYREDPVRMLRAVRFAAKLNFTIAPATAKPIPALAHLLEEMSSHRLYDECQKLFASGHAAPLLPLMQGYGLFAPLFPGPAEHPCEQLWLKTAQSTDARLAEGKHINPAFFFAALLWGDVQARAQALINDGVPPVPAWQQAGTHAVSRQLARTAIPKHVSQVMRDIWEMQMRLESPRPRQVEIMATNERFRAGYDFLLMRESVGEATGKMAAWWTRWQAADPGLQAEMQRALAKPEAAAAPKKRRRRPKKAASPSQ
ncbi:MAG: polynucleotide adenylyltransferase PcnB [Paraperlucidibaca sp.]|jgi:poly(A) polymerase|nr:polynucleotide adenylyltransferase PcnB [Paraperlucidibaca sp.]MBQ0723546.1 polynucleotide adenylyltransferase PcnB [Paraperlucidibaca sp.]MBQ0842377.1 polynucleotide adenylyltransferase PcnB [Paraperlucidibaca sp.]|tara:strand:+ start:6154 stop:7491 length:1338 start_codon:yes stop_codon:yes gene_type:complete